MDIENGDRAFGSAASHALGYISEVVCETSFPDVCVWDLSEVAVLVYRFSDRVDY